MALFIFNKEAMGQIKTLKPQDLSYAGIKEEVLRDLLVTHLDQLDEERRLMVVACEYSNWSDANRRIDVLAIDENQNLVVVELKRTHDGGHAELQALRYAAMLSTHTFANVVQAFVHHRRKKEKEANAEQAEADLLEFLGKADASEVTLGKIPRIILVAQGFSTEVTSTALWLMEHMPIEIACYTVALYPYGNEYVLHFDLLLPLPQQTDYFVKVREKNKDEADQAEKAQRRQRACQVLEMGGQLKTGDTLVLVRYPLQKLQIADDLQKQAVYLGSGRVRWAFDGLEYNSLTQLCTKLCQECNAPLKSSVQGTAFWGKTGTNISLTQAAIEWELNA